MRPLILLINSWIIITQNVSSFIITIVIIIVGWRFKANREVLYDEQFKLKRHTIIIVITVASVSHFTMTISVWNIYWIFIIINMNRSTLIYKQFESEIKSKWILRFMIYTSESTTPRAPNDLVTNTLNPHWTKIIIVVGLSHWNRLLPAFGFACFFYIILHNSRFEVRVDLNWMGNVNTKCSEYNI